MAKIHMHLYAGGSFNHAEFEWLDSAVFRFTTKIKWLIGWFQPLVGEAISGFYCNACKNGWKCAQVLIGISIAILKLARPGGLADFLRSLRLMRLNFLIYSLP